MGRVLALVAGALVFFIAALGLAVYFTRDEDNLQADNLLAENFTKAVDARARERRPRRPARRRALRVGSRAARAARHARARRSRERLGHEWTGIDTVDGGDLLLFLRDGKVVRFADYRGSNTFEGFERPFDGARRARTRPSASATA